MMDVPSRKGARAGLTVAKALSGTRLGSAGALPALVSVKPYFNNVRLK